MIPVSKTIALVDYFWQGHHPTYFLFFAKALAESGWRVVPFCPEPKDFEERWRAHAAATGSELPACHPAEAAPSFRPSRIRPCRLRGWHEAWQRFGGLKNRMEEWSRRHGTRINQVFFACVYDRQFEKFGQLQGWLRRPWAGLYLHARAFRMPGTPVPYTGGLPCPQKIFRGKWLSGVGLLDEGAAEPMRKLVSGRAVSLFPDLTDEALPPDNGREAELARHAKEQAAGRPIICLAGHLQRTKGLEEFTVALESPELAGAFFVLAGEINWSEVPEAQRSRWEEAWRRSTRLLTNFHPMPERQMNALLATADVIFAAYRDFPNSSNILTKAAIFQKPVLVSDGYLMAERVRKYRLGEIIPEGDARAAVAALARMTAPGYAARLKTEARWAEYRELHSVKKLKQCFEELLGKPASKSNLPPVI